MWPLNIARMLLLRGLKIDPPRNKLLWIILLKVVGSTTYSIPTTSKYEDKVSKYGTPTGMAGMS